MFNKDLRRCLQLNAWNYSHETIIVIIVPQLYCDQFATESLLHHYKQLLWASALNVHRIKSTL